MMDKITELSQFLKLYRLKNGLNQTDTASNLGISFPYYGNIEQGRRRVSGRLAEKILNFFTTNKNDRRKLINLIEKNNNEIYQNSKLYKKDTSLVL